MSVKIDKEACIGCGACTAVCPDVFEMKDGKSYVKADGKCAKDGADACPVDAIKVE